MEKQNAKKRRKGRPEASAASLGLVWSNLKFSVKAFFKRRGSRSGPAAGKKPADSVSEDSHG